MRVYSVSMGRISKHYDIFKVILSLFTILFMMACNDFSFNKGMSHGKIEYTITYPGIPADNFMLDVMPKKMETTFIDNSYRSDIIAGMGLVKTSIIFKEGDDKLLHSFKMLAEKYYSELDFDDLELISPDFQNISIELNDEVKEIAGYQCKGADVTVTGDSTWSFKLFYTEKIMIKDANLYTPFKEIKGVLMEYEINSYDTHMRFVAQNVNQVEVAKEEINLEEGYSIVEPIELKKQIENVFSKVK